METRDERENGGNGAFGIPRGGETKDDGMNRKERWFVKNVA